MRLRYDPASDAAYVDLDDTWGEDTRRFGFTYPCDPAQVNGQINLDFDVEGRLIGVEILDASKMLPSELLP